MWPIPSITDDIVGCIISPTSFVLTHYTYHNQSLTLQAYQHIQCFSGELEKSLICNPTQITLYLNQFISERNLHDASVYCTLSGPAVHEHIILQKPLSAASNQFKENPYNQQTYLYSKKNSSVVYQTFISPAVIFQYHLLALRSHIHLAMITTPFIALLKLYTIVQGTAFRHTQLAQDLQQHHHRIEYCFSIETIKRLLHIPSTIDIDLVNDLYFLLSSMGLVYLRR